MEVVGLDSLWQGEIVHRKGLTKCTKAATTDHFTEETKGAEEKSSMAVAVPAMAVTVTPFPHVVDLAQKIKIVPEPTRSRVRRKLKFKKNQRPPSAQNMRRRHRGALWTVLVLLVEFAAGQCPNFCSGHGECGPENVCNCFQGYDYAPDCSLRT